MSAAQNERTPAMHRQEARVTAQLPADAPAPRLLGCYDDGTWIALVLEDIEGRHPVTPRVCEELDRVLEALERLARGVTPSPVPGLDPVADTLAHDLASWDRIAADPPADLDPWAADHLDELRSSAARGLRALAGDPRARRHPGRQPAHRPRRRRHDRRLAVGQPRPGLARHPAEQRESDRSRGS